MTIQKFDPYINIDPGTLNPYEHGECFVTDDGAETVQIVPHITDEIKRRMLLLGQDGQYAADFAKAGLVASGVNPDTNLVE